MERPYRITTNPTLRLIEIGFLPCSWSMEVAERFMADCAAAVAGTGPLASEMMVLVDLRQAVLQSQEVIGAMQRMIGRATVRRIALVAATPLARMQTKRLRIADNVLLFAELAEARAWLLDKATEAEAA